MSEQASGVVQFVKQNDYGFFSFKMNDEWYGTGSKRDPGVAKGDRVEFEYYLKDDRWATVKGKITKTGKAKVAPAASTGRATGGSTKDGYWEAKTLHEQTVVEPRITRQAALKAANEFLANPLVIAALTPVIEKQKKDKLETLRALVLDTADAFVVYANGPKAAPAAKAVEEEHVEETESEDTDESEELEE